MKAVITEITLPVSEASSRGLGPLRLTDLTELVAIAGPNGAGKSRLLQCIADAARGLGARAGLLAERDKLGNLIKTHEDIVDGLRSQLSVIRSNRDNLVIQINNNNSQIDNLKKSLENIVSQLSSYPTDLIVDVEDIYVIFLEANMPQPRDVLSATIREIDGSVSSVGTLKNFGRSLQDSKRIIWGIAERYLRATSDKVERGEAVTLAVKRFEALRDIIQILLGTDLIVTPEIPVVLFGRHIDEANLSHGQMILLQFAASIFSVNDDLPCIVFLDEPENHLHPLAQIGLLEQLKKVLPNGQIILATHSVPLLAHIGAEKIWSMNDRRVSKTGKDIQLVLRGLVGGDAEIAGLRDFIDEPDRLAASSFALECLRAPGTELAKQGDPQQLQMVQAIEALWAQDRPIRVLDWGAGKGRLATALSEVLRERGHEPADLVHYFAYNPRSTPEDRGICLQAMKPFGDAGKRYLERKTSLLDTFQEDGADLVIMCNVLHEIDPRHWRELFRDIDSIISANGSLILIEDLEISKGEMAFPDGFFLMDEAAIAALFCARRSMFISETDSDPRYRGRLMQYTIPKALLVQVSDTSIKAAIRWGLLRALANLRDLRSEGEDESSPDERAARHRGRRHALYAQQVANACLFLGPSALEEASRSEV